MLNPDANSVVLSFSFVFRTSSFFPFAVYASHNGSHEPSRFFL